LFNLASSYADVDYYHVLLVSKHATKAELKVAYHKALLEAHPDKRKQKDLAAAIDSASKTMVDIDTVKEAYRVLSDDELRAIYDSKHSAGRHSVATGPRPAQVVSLEEFTEGGSEADGSDEQGNGVWTYQCRCGGLYQITAALMEDGVHLVACSSCSEAVWVGYELAESEE
ncbi:hypothetical protein CVT24_007930, partial [Panaeolus cyanescens]